MLPHARRHAVRCFTPIAAALLAALALLPPARAAEEGVEMETDLHGAVGKLKDETRQAAPEIEPASDEPTKAIAHMQLPAGLKATLWAAEPMFANPVAFNIDEHGRVFVAETYRYRTSVLDIRDYMWTLEDDLANRTQEDFLASIKKNFGEAGLKELSKESERLSLLEDTDGDGKADKAGVYADNFRSPIDGIASGVVARRGEVWFSNIPALWKFTGRDKAETRTELLRGFGLRFNFTGHDFHGLIFGPDGRLYMSIGDRAATVPTKEGTVVSAPDTGSVFRCDPDGTHFELFATGLRNPQSLLFNEYGDLFTGDNDSDQGDEERLVHVVEGGDSGWRIGYQHNPRGNAGPWNSEKLWHPRFKGQPAYILPPICNIEDGPSGVAYYPGTGLTPAFAHTIFVTHFKGAISNSGIYAYTVKPDGASYAIDTAAPFLTGALPTDVRFGPDGKLYYSDWAEGWPKSRRGRIYTIFDPKFINDPLIKSTQQLIGSDYTKKSADELAGLLAHPDWRVRLEAQFTLAERGAPSIAVFTGVLNASDSPLARRHAVWGLGQVARTDAAALVPLKRLVHDHDAEIRAQSLKLLGDFRQGDSTDDLIAALKDENNRVKFFAAQSLGKLKAPSALPALLAAARANNDADAYLRHAIVLGLAGCATPEQLAATTSDESPAVRRAAVLALRRLVSPEITKFLADSDFMIVREAVLAIADVPITAAFPAVAEFLTQPVAEPEIMLRALNVNFRLGTPANAKALAAFAASDAPAPLRQEAIELLALWPKPPARDRVVGVYRPLPDKTRPVAVASAALEPQLATLFSDRTPETVQTATIDALVALGLNDALPALRTLVGNTGASGAVRAAALKALDALHDPDLAAAAAAALASDAPELRLAALPINSRLSPAAAMASLTRLIIDGTVKEQQTAYAALGATQDPAVDDLLFHRLEAFAAGKIAPAAQLDLLEAAAKRRDPRIQQFLARRDAELAGDRDPLAAYRVCLEGGNIGSGRKIFATQPVMQCIRCHRVGDSPGGEAGPNLAGIGARGSREYILESILKPSAKIAAGFEIVTITKKDGSTVAGTVLRRDANSLLLRTGDDATTEVASADIRSVESAPSAMPEIAALVLKKSEIRDLVAALASLTDVPPPAGKKVLRALQHLDAE
ncbi:MAG TPA: HEAT repeat domain-containing protein [Lacunisphaera sp.]|nr:HEAT repeat domain-containing protein [Lacunisphaera sp.]